MGFPEIGSVRISEIADLERGFDLVVERDDLFVPSKTLSAYADEASKRGQIVA